MLINIILYYWIYRKWFAFTLKPLVWPKFALWSSNTVKFFFPVPAYLRKEGWWCALHIENSCYARYSNVLVAILTLTYVLALIWFLSSHSLSKWERVHITCSFSINFVRELIGLYLHIVFNHFAAGSNILGSLLIAFYRPIHTGKIHSRTRRK